MLGVTRECEKKNSDESVSRNIPVDSAHFGKQTGKISTRRIMFIFKPAFGNKVHGK